MAIDFGDLSVEHPPWTVLPDPEDPEIEEDDCQEIRDRIEPPASAAESVQPAKRQKHRAEVRRARADMNDAALLLFLEKRRRGRQ